ncbi:MarR family winged helix-turn-helix transcriptional regulator [Solibacillus sp. FSL K6-1523]|uniref:MarR family winged helix-turn-helix transcriptional regulator n=1 Tax=Solibacillus sp. FSL K6-1523 TaxID=2921471 RepID=UPI0030F84868
MNLSKQVFFDIMLTFHPFGKQLNQFLEEYELRRPDWAVFQYLVTEPQLSLSEVGELLNYDPANVTRAIKYLTKINLIEIHPSTIDRRKKNIQITTKGQQTYEVLQQRITQLEERLVYGFSQDELEITHRTLQTIRHRLLEKE